MGRIHRYGQKYEVFVYNLVAADTIEGRIFKRLFEKLDEIRHAMNSDKVYDIIGEIYYGKDLSQLLIDAAMGARTEGGISAPQDGFWQGIVLSQMYPTMLEPSFSFG